jgi:hypothetical protein
MSLFVISGLKLLFFSVKIIFELHVRKLAMRLHCELTKGASVNVFVRNCNVQKSVTVIAATRYIIARRTTRLFSYDDAIGRVVAMPRSGHRSVGANSIHGNLSSWIRSDFTAERRRSTSRSADHLLIADHQWCIYEQ